MATRNLRGAAALIAIVSGVGLLVATPALSLFSGAPAGQRILNRFNSTFSPRGPTELSSGFYTVRAMSDQFFGSTLPDVSLHMSPQQFDAYLRARYPAVAAGQREIPPAVKFVAPTIPMINGARGDFQSARTLPAFGLSARSTPWLLLGVGGALVLLAGGALAAPAPVGEPRLRPVRSAA